MNNAIDDFDDSKWSCDYCGHKNIVGHAFCENCFNDHK